MGTKQTKGCQPGSAGESPPGHHRKKAAPRERGDFLASLVVKSGEKFGKGAGGSLPPYHRRICMIQDMLLLVKQGKQEEATELLKNLRQVRMGGFLRWEGGCGEGEKCGERPILLRGKPKRGPRSAFAGLALVASFWGSGRGAAGWSRCQRGGNTPGEVPCVVCSEETLPGAFFLLAFLAGADSSGISSLLGVVPTQLSKSLVFRAAP